MESVNYVRLENKSQMYSDKTIDRFVLAYTLTLDASNCVCGCCFSRIYWALLERHWELPSFFKLNITLYLNIVTNQLNSDLWRG